ncbi:hypothetical protein SAMN04489724_0429 [Algoriphagus locisalis]|uniref:Sugar phosphate permease n=1 Tax=Algoriphagus locisalis TaxID=305507 RepID=A0A1I6XF48_9BACT|nr:DUF5690 family protein [Algoriphagus locisalis]SFT36642.1 hypothetical protein SAMN04489724_0429 [Algoriphagus locisalis]
MKNTYTLLHKYLPQKSTVLLMVGAFLCYTGMYAVRKAFLAGQYLDLEFFGLDFKTVLVISQVMGYMFSKFVGIKLVSEMTSAKRATYLVGLVGFGLLMLLAFALLPTDFKPIALFLNGMPLGMVFGLVFSYLEGRKNTELLAAALSATFIFSTGFVKTVGVWLMQDFGVGEYIMPFLTGLLFFPLFLVAVRMLSVSQQRSEEDLTLRSERLPMNARQRWDFLRKHGLVFGGLVVVYVLLTIVRDFRDNFMVEFWAELGMQGSPELITYTEIPVAVLVLVLAAFGVLIRDNRKAFNYGIYLSMVCCIGIVVLTWFFERGMVSPVWWMVINGVGLYLPYILFHCLIFERFVALLRFSGNVGFLFYTADALGYTGSVGVMLFKEFSTTQVTWVNFLGDLNQIAGVIMTAVCIITLFLLQFKSKKQHELALNT